MFQEEFNQVTVVETDGMHERCCKEMIDSVDIGAQVQKKIDGSDPVLYGQPMERRFTSNIANPQERRAAVYALSRGQRVRFDEFDEVGKWHVANRRVSIHPPAAFFPYTVSANFFASVSNPSRPACCFCGLGWATSSWHCR